MSRAAEWHATGDCNSLCPLCEHEDAVRRLEGLSEADVERAFTEEEA